MTYNPMLLEGSVFAEFFAPALFANDTVGKNYVRILTGIKNKQIVTSIGGDVEIIDYVEDAILPAANAGGITLGDRYVEPIKKMILQKLTQDQLRNSRFAANMQAGAKNIDSLSFQDLVKGYASEKTGEGIQNLFWAMVKTKLAAEADSVKIAATPVTKNNVAAQMEAVYDKLVAPLKLKKQATVFADYTFYDAITKANVDPAKFRDQFQETATGHSYLGMDIKYVPLGANVMTAGLASDYILATDLTGDFGSLEIVKEQTWKDTLVMKNVFTLDAAVVVPAQKVIVS